MELDIVGEEFATVRAGLAVDPGLPVPSYVVVRHTHRTAAQVDPVEPVFSNYVAFYNNAILRGVDQHAGLLEGVYKQIVDAPPWLITRPFAAPALFPLMCTIGSPAKPGWENPAMVVNGWFIGGSSTVGRMVQLASAPGHPGRLNAMLLPWPVLAMWIASRRCSRP